MFQNAERYITECNISHYQQANPSTSREIAIVKSDRGSPAATSQTHGQKACSNQQPIMDADYRSEIAASKSPTGDETAKVCPRSGTKILC